MSALSKKLPITSVAYVEPRYWEDENELLNAAKEIHSAISLTFAETGTEVNTITIRSEDDLHRFLEQPRSALGIFSALSGAVQPWMLRSASHFESIAIAGGFIEGFVGERTAKLMLERNASPASMDVYSVLHEQHKSVTFATDTKSIMDFWRAVQAVQRLRSATMLLVGDTEQWVISSSRDHATFASRLGLSIQQIELRELYEVFHATNTADAHALAERWSTDAVEIREPERTHIDDACRVTASFKQLLEKYNADALAIACFTLLKDLGTTSCLAVSELNDTPEYVGGCEGDLDAGATLLLMKALSSDAAWMGNPVVAKDNSLMLVHCTAPRQIRGERRPYVLRNHHESGIGVSPAVQMPVGLPVTLSRIGRNASALSVHVGEAVAIPDEPTCRTQLTIKLPSMERYLSTSLGNHQVLTYGDYSAALRNVADILHLTLLN